MSDVTVSVTGQPAVSVGVNPVGASGPQGAPGDDGADGVPGSDGREVELQVSATHVQWRYVGDVSWTNLIALADLEGPQGIQGVPGEDGADGAPGADGSAGAAGTDGSDGEAPMLRVDSGFIQWKLPSDVSWTNLVALSAITGPAGSDGADGATGADGDDGAPGVGVSTGGSTGQVLKKNSGTDYDTAWGADLSIAAGSANNPHTTKTATRNSALPKNHWQYTGVDGVDNPTNAISGDEWISA